MENGRRKKKEKKEKQKNPEGYLLVLYTVNPSTPPGAFQCCSVQNLLFPCPSSWSSGGGAAVLILRCVHLGALPRPLPGARLVGAVYHLRSLFPGGPALFQAQGDTRRSNHTGGGQLSSPGVSSRSNYRSSQSALAWMLPGLGELHSPLLGAGLSGSCLSCEAPVPWQPRSVPGTR